MIRLLELVTISLRARASSETRVWTALLLPILAGTVMHWTTRMKLEGLLLMAASTTSFPMSAQAES